MIIKKDIPSLIRVGKYPVIIRYKGQKLCCHHCNRWGHPVSECPYKINKLCIRCGSAGHIARDCVQPWVLDNSPVVINNLEVEPTQISSADEVISQEGQATSAQASSSSGQAASSSLAEKRPPSTDKPKKKKSKTQKENPEAFTDVVEEFSLDNLPFVTSMSTDSPQVSLQQLATGNQFSALVEEEVESSMDASPHTQVLFDSSASSDNTIIPPSMVSKVAQAIQKTSSATKRLGVKTPLQMAPLVSLLLLLSRVESQNLNTSKLWVFLS